MHVREIYELAQLSGASGEAIAVQTAREVPPGGWPSLLELGRSHRMLPLIHSALRRGNALGLLPENVSRELVQAARATAASNMLFTAEHERIRNAARAAGLQLLPLKGIAFLDSLYKLDERPLMDLDYLIPPAQQLDFQALMLNLGYEPNQSVLPGRFAEIFSGEKVFVRQAGGSVVSAELHVELIPMFAMRRAFPLNEERLLDQAVERNGHPMLRPEHELLFTAVHFAAVHCFSRLIWLSDVDRLVRHNIDMDWDFFIKETRAARSRRLIRVVLDAAVRLFHTPVPDAVLKASGGAKPDARRVDSWLAGQCSGMEISLIPFLLSEIPARYLLQQVFPSPEYIRMRYGIAQWKVPFFYVVRPALLIKNALSARDSGA